MASRQLAFFLAGAVALALAAPAAAEPSAEPKALRKHSFPVRQGPLPASEKAAWTHAPYEAGDCSICHVSADRRKPGPLTTSGNQLCYSCHDEFQEIMRRPYKHPPAEESCLHCHNAHDSRERKLLHTELATGCKDCHRQVKEVAERSRVKHGALEQGAKCANCHNPHGTSVEKLLIQLPFDQCVNCHARGRHEGRPGHRPHQLQEVAGGEQGPRTRRSRPRTAPPATCRTAARTSACWSPSTRPPSTRRTTARTTRSASAATTRRW